MPSEVDFRREFVKGLKSLTGSYDLHTIFYDYITMAAASLHNAVAFSQYLEDGYMRAVEKYKKDEVAVFTKLLAFTVNGLQEDAHDFLGKSYMELELGNKNTGQFFTPDPVCQMLAQMTIGNLDEQFKEKKFLTVSDPACGGGATLIAAAREFLSQGYPPEDYMCAFAVDVDHKMALTCYIQLALLGIPAEIKIGNTLTNKHSQVFYTPVYYWKGWHSKLQEG